MQVLVQLWTQQQQAYHVMRLHARLAAVLLEEVRVEPAPTAHNSNA